MNRGERRGFFRRYSLGIVLVVLVYLLVTVLRSIRADFAPEIWNGLGYSGQPSVFARSQLLVVLAVMAVCGLAFLIVDNQRAFFFALAERDEHTLAVRHNSPFQREQCASTCRSSSTSPTPFRQRPLPEQHAAERICAQMNQRSGKAQVAQIGIEGCWETYRSAILAGSGDHADAHFFRES